MSLRRSPLLADRVNIAILTALIAEPRRSISELARIIGMSAPATRERVQRLEDAGLLKGCQIQLDASLLGYPVAVMIRVRPMPGKLPDLMALARDTPRVVECHRITGEDCFIMRAHIESIDALDGLIDTFLAFGQTTTSIIQSSPVPLRSLPVNELPTTDRRIE